MHQTHKAAPVRFLADTAYKRKVRASRGENMTYLGRKRRVFSDICIDNRSCRLSQFSPIATANQKLNWACNWIMRTASPLPKGPQASEFEVSNFSEPRFPAGVATFTVLNRLRAFTLRVSVYR